MVHKYNTFCHDGRPVAFHANNPISRKKYFFKIIRVSPDTTTVMVKHLRNRNTICWIRLPKTSNGRSTFSTDMVL
ncbi:hypothetical protein AAOP42_20640 [Reichenbachiella sp. MALMAid0571]